MNGTELLQSIASAGPAKESLKAPAPYCNGLTLFRPYDSSFVTLFSTSERRSKCRRPQGASGCFVLAKLRRIFQCRWFRLTYFLFGFGSDSTDRDYLIVERGCLLGDCDINGSIDS